MLSFGDILFQKWLRKGWEKGRQHEAAKLTSRLVNQRFGEVHMLAHAYLYIMPVEQLEELNEALLDFHTPDDLITWLRKRIDSRSAAL